MARSKWKGGFVSCDYTFIYTGLSAIPLSKANVYLFTQFKGIVFDIYDKGHKRLFVVQHVNLGFKLGVFLFSRETDVYHTKKKSKKQKARSRFFKKPKIEKNKRNFLKKQIKKSVKVLNISWNLLKNY